MLINDILTKARSVQSPRFANWLAFVLRWECEYDRGGHIRTENDPADPGGMTFAGIDRRSHPEFDFKAPDAESVARIYWADYWARSRAEEMPHPVGEVVANYAVNTGIRRASLLLQAAINRTEGGGTVRVDGVIGPQTLAAVQAEDPHQLADLIEDSASDFYRGLASARPRMRKFLAGWLNRNRSLEKWWMEVA